MLQVFTSIAPLFLIIFGAAALVRLQYIGKEWEHTLNEFALKIGLPALIFTALASTSFSFAEEAALIGANSAFIGASFLAALALGALLRLKKPMFLTLFICFIFGNVAYLGIPLLTTVYGEGVLPMLSLIIAIYLFWIFSVAIAYLEYESEKSRKRDVLKKVLMHMVTNPLLLAVLGGLIVGGFSIPLPAMILESLELLASSVTPVVLVVIGLFIGSSSLGKIKDWIPVMLFTILTLVVLPAAFYGAVVLGGFDLQFFELSILEAAMPLAITPFALADQYKLEKAFIARTIVLSTICSVITIPGWIWILSL